jgi:hypothetical protein
VSGGPAPSTVGEQLFARYLQEQGLPFDFERPRAGKSKVVDFTGPFDGAEYLFDCKDFEKDDFRTAPGFVGFYDPVEPVRAKSDAVRRKFSEYAEFSCSPVLCNVRSLVHLDDPTSVLSAMHGDFTFGFMVNTKTGSMVPGTETNFFGNGGKMTRAGGVVFHTRISALVAVREVPIGRTRHVGYLSQFPSAEWIDRLADDVPFDPNERGLGVIVYENKDAVRPLSRELFQGNYDERWTYDGAAIECVFRGTDLQEVRDLEQRGRERAEARFKERKKGE